MTEKPFERAQLALSMGLPREALDGILLKSQVLLFGGDGARLQLQLLLDLGRVEDAAQFFASEEVTSSRASLGLVTFPAPGRTGVAGITRLPALAWLSACHAAATGQYSKAVAALRDLAAEMHRESDTVRERLAPAVRLAVASEAATGAVGEGLTWHAQRWEHRNRLTGLLELGESLRPQEAEMLLLAGLLELERGKPDDADTLLRRATETEGAGPAVHELANAYRRRIDAARREPDPEPPPPPPPAGPPVGGRPGGPPGGGRPGGGRPGGPPPA
jgi:hypothetical protein